ncbi:MAG: ankyrin repeat domain-containing protein, partial [Myxococcota bacterium]
AEEGHRDVIETLLQNNADPNILDSWGRNALHCALQGDHIHVARWLMRNVLPVKTIKKEQQAAAKRAKRLPIIRLLLREGTNQNQRDQWGYTPVNWAMQWLSCGYKKIAQELFDYDLEHNGLELYDIQKHPGNRNNRLSPINLCEGKKIKREAYTLLAVGFRPKERFAQQIRDKLRTYGITIRSITTIKDFDLGCLKNREVYQQYNAVAFPAESIRSAKEKIKHQDAAKNTLFIGVGERFFND